MDKIFIKGVLQLKDFFETKLLFEELRISPKGYSFSYNAAYAYKEKYIKDL